MLHTTQTKWVEPTFPNKIVTNYGKISSTNNPKVKCQPDTVYALIRQTQQDSHSHTALIENKRNSQLWQTKQHIIVVEVRNHLQSDD